DVDPIVPEKESSKKEPATTVVVQKKVDRSRASPKEARIRHEYPQPAPRDRNVGPRLSGRREEGEYPSNRALRGARPSERGRGRGGNRRGREYDRHSGTENQSWGHATTSWENNETLDNSWGGETKENDAPASSWDDSEKPGPNENGWGDGANGQNAHESNANEGGSNWDAPVEAGENWESGVNENENSTAEDKAEFKSREVKEEAAADDETTAAVVEKTFDEYLAEKAQKVLDLSLPEARKPNEGVDDSQWKDAVPLEKDDEDVLFAGKEQAFRLKSKKSKAKNYLEIEPTYDRPANFPRGRGRGRGGGPRGGRERRDNRDGRERDRRDNYRDNYDSENRDNRRRGGGTSNEDERRHLLLSEDSVRTIRSGLELYTSTSFSSMPTSHYSYSDVVRVSINAPSMYNKVTKDIQKYNKGVRAAVKLRGMKNMWEKARNMIQEKKYLFIAVDVESYERDHSCILETSEKWTIRSGHERSIHLWNHNEFMKDLESQKGNVVLVGHDIKTDVKYIESMGMDVSSVIERFDTADMNAARVGKPNERINLGRLLDELDIENYSLHNA
ncbi:18778_t:CDS:2, partial [Racocetra fulgida]